MNTIDDVIDWLSEQSTDDFMLGYGSLMSHSSRSVHSDIHCPSIMVSVNGFERGWVTRSTSERQTYVGAWENPLAQLNAQLVPVTFDPGFQTREQDYTFERVDFNALDFPASRETSKLESVLANKRLWICRTLEMNPADEHHPVNATYVATCLAGCLETGNEAQAHQFMQQTQQWPEAVNNDFDAPQYPRAASLNDSLRERIQQLLAEYAII